MSYGRMAEREAALAAEVQAILDAAEAVDAAEDARYGDARGDELPEQLRRRETRLARIREAKAALPARGPRADRRSRPRAWSAGQAQLHRPREPDHALRRGYTRVTTKHQVTLGVDALRAAGIRTGDVLRAEVRGPGELLLVRDAIPVEQSAGGWSGMPRRSAPRCRAGRSRCDAGAPSRWGPWQGSCSCHPAPGRLADSGSARPWPQTRTRSTETAG